MHELRSVFWSFKPSKTIEDELRKLAKLAKYFLIMGAQMPPGPFIYVFLINIWVLIHPEKVGPPCSSSFLLHDPLLEKGEIKKIRFHGDQKIGFSG